MQAPYTSTLQHCDVAVAAVTVAMYIIRYVDVVSYHNLIANHRAYLSFCRLVEYGDP